MFGGNSDSGPTITHSRKVSDYFRSLESMVDERLLNKLVHAFNIYEEILSLTAEKDANNKDKKVVLRFQLSGSKGLSPRTECRLTA